VADNPDIADIRSEFVIAQNGGASLFSLRDRTRADGPQLLKRLRDSALATDGVDEALYRQPNPADGGEQHWVGRVHPDWHQTGPRSGDLILTVDDGRRSTEPSSTSNPIPGNHGMPSTLRIPTIVTGGADAGVVRRTVAGVDDPDVRAADQAENVDMAPTAAWLMGVDPPATGFDGRVLSEAFSARPEPTCVAAAAAPGMQVPGPSASPSPSATSSTAGQPPAAAAPSSSRRLPATGPVWALPVAGLALLGGAVLLRRRRTT
jgi:LPXTG-motif cell wall-anchored protein